MDEIDKINEIKKVLKVFAKIAVGVSAFFILISLISILRGNYKGEEFVLTGTLLLVGLCPFAVVCLCYGVLIIIDKLINSGITVINFNRDYIRDLPKHCSPAITSFIYNLKIDIYKDYTATILYLSLKHYINFVKEGHTYKIEPNLQKDYSNLGRCEKYVLGITLNNNIFDENIFKQEIIKETQERNLITDKKMSKVPKIILIAITEIVLMVLTYKINFILFLIYTSVSLSALYAYFGIYVSYKDDSDEYIQYKRTKDGKNLALLFKGLKSYIKEYTLIKDKGIDYIQILEDYIPYALCLDEATAVEEFVKHNEEYRDMIYNRRK